MAAGLGDRSLQGTPTWAVALVCALFVIISIFIEHGIQSLGKLFKKRNKKAMTEALEKIKAELMLLGFISLLLSVGTTYVVKICIPIKLGDKLLPCEDQKKGGYDDDDGDKRGGGGDDRRKLLSYAEEIIWHRALEAGDEKEDHCAAQMMKWKTWESETSSLEYQFTNDPARFRYTYQTSFVKRHAGFSTTPGQMDCGIL